MHRSDGKYKHKFNQNKSLRMAHEIMKKYYVKINS